MTTPSFKQAAAQDFAAFINATEFADWHEIDGARVYCVVDGDLLQTRGRSPAPGGLNDGVFMEQMVVFVQTSDVPHPPVVGERLRFDGSHYYVGDCFEEMGILQITLQANET